MLYNYKDIESVHLEVTERCNASCPQCDRNINGGEINPNLVNSELSIDDIKKIFSISFIKQLKHLSMCGNYGDPIVAKDTLAIFDFLRENNQQLFLTMNTNGSARTSDWWTALAKVLGINGCVIFSIDGLEDTNHLYRKDTNFNKIIDNVKSFINAGGNAHWEYLVFRHNEHQVNEAKKLANELGIQEFRVKKSDRFLSFFGDRVKENIIFIDKNNNKISIQTPSNPLYRHERINEKLLPSSDIQVLKLPTTKEEVYGKVNPEIIGDKKLTDVYNNVTINCKVKKERSIFISARGIVHPCCWVGGMMYPWYYMTKRTQIWKIINKIGLEKINALNSSLEEIIEGSYFNLIEESWSKKSCSEGKLRVCAKTCGETIETFSKQYM